MEGKIDEIKKIELRAISIATYGKYILAFMECLHRRYYLRVSISSSKPSTCRHMFMLDHGFNNKLKIIKFQVKSMGSHEILCIYGISRDYIEYWNIAMDGSILNHAAIEIEGNMSLLSLSYGNQIKVMCGNKNSVLIFDSRLTLLTRIQQQSETPCELLYFEQGENYFICYESGLILAWEIQETTNICIFNHTLSVSGATALSKFPFTICNMCEIVPISPKNNTTNVQSHNRLTASSRPRYTFCVCSMEGKIWILELLDDAKNSVRCVETRCLDIRKYLRPQLVAMNDGNDGNTAMPVMDAKKSGTSTATGVNAVRGARRIDDMNFRPVPRESGLDNNPIANTAGEASSANISSEWTVIAAAAGACINSPISDHGLQSGYRCDVYFLLSNGFIVTLHMADYSFSHSFVFKNTSLLSKGFISAIHGHTERDVSYRNGIPIPVAVAVALSAFDGKCFDSTIFSTPLLRSDHPGASKKANVDVAVEDKVSQANISIRKEGKKELNLMTNLPKWAQNVSSSETVNSARKCSDNDSDNADNSLSGNDYIENSSNTCSIEQISIFLENRIITSKSPLSGAIKDKVKSENTLAHGERLLKGSWEVPVKGKNGNLVDLPVTFHTKIKSSGYGKKEVLYSKVAQNQMRSLSAPRGSGSSSGTNRRGKPTVSNRIRSYPQNCGLLTTHQEHNDYPLRGSGISPVPITSIRFSGNGAYLGHTCTSGTGIGVLRMPIGKHHGDGCFYMGHNNLVNSLEFSHACEAENQLIISSSDDFTARIWKLGKVDSAVVTFTHKNCNLKVGSTSSTTTSVESGAQRNKPFTSPITFASFFYVDQFTLLSTKASVLMYAFTMDDLDCRDNDIKRLQASGRYRLVHEWDMENAHNITAMKCLNCVQSPLVFVGTSDRKLQILDAVSGNVMRSVDSTHDRPIHSIALPQPSLYSSLPQDNFHVLATSSTDSSIVSWDIRQVRPTFRYAEHVNRREKIQSCYSPCMRYLATGSEDRSARLIDLRMCKEIYKLNGYHRDVVSGVAFHPIYPQIVTCSYDGTIKCFVDEIL